VCGTSDESLGTTDLAVRIRGRIKGGASGVKHSFQKIPEYDPGKNALIMSTLKIIYKFQELF
jgi:hypothetical protein